MHARPKARTLRRAHGLALVGMAVILALAVLVLADLDQASPAETQTQADYHDFGRWPGQSPSVCVQDETRGFPVDEAVAEFDGVFDFFVADHCAGHVNVVRVVPVINAEASNSGWFQSERDEHGRYESAVIYLNVDQAFRLDPHAWQMVLVHELGHAAGLEHADGHGSVMDPIGYADADGLSDTDREQIREVYSR